MSWTLRETRFVSRIAPFAGSVAAALIAVLAVALLSAPRGGAVSGGRPVSPTSYPWFARVADDQCGAVLISPQRLVTDTSCAENVEGSAVRIGRQRRLIVGSSFPSAVIDALVRGDQVDCGPYDGEPCEPNIAIMRLSRPVRGIKPLPVARATAGRRGILVGRGTRYLDDESESTRLRAATMRVMADRSCRARYRNDSSALRHLTPAWTFCADDPRPPRNAGICVGDGGAPLLRHSDSAWRLLGIGSFATACGEDNWPSAFTDASAFREFITRPHPTWRPRTSGSVTVTGTAGVGHTLTCHAPRFTGQVDRLIYWFYDETGDRTLQRGERASYVVREGDDVTCWVLAVNRGGVTRAVPGA